jgi:methyl-accepting chemotaxis protein
MVVEAKPKTPKTRSAEASRTRISRNTEIIVPRGSSVIFCTVETITGGGARLKLANTFGVPDTFELTFERGRTRRSCRVVWRTGDKLSVAYEAAGQ